jgi:predicted nucleotidyltransferase
MGEQGVVVAECLVMQRFPEARAAWLGGSVAAGEQTSTSDLDITVLLGGPPAPFRSSEVVDGWPVEFFVQTEC